MAPELVKSILLSINNKFEIDAEYYTKKLITQRQKVLKELRKKYTYPTYTIDDKLFGYQDTLFCLIEVYEHVPTNSQNKVKKSHEKYHYRYVNEIWKELVYWWDCTERSLFFTDQCLRK